MRTGIRIARRTQRNLSTFAKTRPTVLFTGSFGNWNVKKATVQKGIGKNAKMLSFNNEKQSNATPTSRNEVTIIIR